MKVRVKLGAAAGDTAVRSPDGSPPVEEVFATRAHHSSARFEWNTFVVLPVVAPGHEGASPRLAPPGGSWLFPSGNPDGGGNLPVPPYDPPSSAPESHNRSAEHEDFVDHWLWAETGMERRADREHIPAPDFLVSSPVTLFPEPDIDEPAVVPPDQPAAIEKAATAPDEPKDDLNAATASRSPGPGKSLWRWPRRIAWLAVAVAAIGFLAGQRAELRITGPFNILPVGSTDVRSRVDGVIERIYVSEGDEVSAGNPIAMLSDRELRADLEKADAEIRQTQAALQMLQAGPTEQEVGLAKAAIATAAGQLVYAKRKLERSQALFSAGLLSRIAYDDAEEQVAKAEGVLGETKAKLAQVVNNVRPQQIDQASAQIDQINSVRRLIEKQMGSLRVFSPVPGIVGTPQRQLLQMQNQFVKKGDVIAKIYDFRSVRAQILISEKEILPVSVGQPVDLKLRAFPDKTFYGKVTFIATSANDPAAATVNSNPGVNVAANTGKLINAIVVYTELENASALLKPEMTGQARIDCGAKRLDDLLLWRLKRYFRIDALSW